ncbi:MAG: PRTRC system protein A [Telluria sp.]
MNGQDLKIKFDELLDITRASYETFLSTSETALRAARPCVLAIDEDNVDDDKLALDMATFHAAPIVAVPRHSEFAPLIENGHRFLLAEGGLFLEVRRPWLHFIHRIGEQDKSVRIPYGPITSKFELGFGRLGTALPQMKEFATYAMVESPIEAAASLLWNHATKEWSLKYPEVIGEATGGSISYKQVEVGEDESLVVDLHSHGVHHAFFSDTDDIDDAGTVKIAGVFGSLDKGVQTASFRLCVLGVYVPITVPADKIFG